MSISRQVQRAQARQAAKGRSLRRNYDQMKAAPERLVACALINEHGEVKHGFKSHAELRGYEPARPDHTYGFWTSNDRFVTRRQAVEVGVASGQLVPSWRTCGRELLSADVW